MNTDSFLDTGHLTRARPGRRLTLPPQVFANCRKTAARSAAVFGIPTCSHILFAYILKMLAPGHLRSGHQLRSSGLTSKNVYVGVIATVVQESLRNFQACWGISTHITYNYLWTLFRWPQVRSFLWTISVNGKIKIAFCASDASKQALFMLFLALW